MKNLVLALMLTVGTAPLAAAYAGEGNGPSFPGLQIPDVAITTNLATGAGRVTERTDHSEMSFAEPRQAFPANPATRRVNSTWSMLESLSRG